MIQSNNEATGLFPGLTRHVWGGGHVAAQSGLAYLTNLSSVCLPLIITRVLFMRTTSYLFRVKISLHTCVVDLKNQQLTQ